MSLLASTIKEYLGENHGKWKVNEPGHGSNYIEISMMYSFITPYILIDEDLHTISLRNTVISSDRTILLQYVYSGETVLQNIADMIELVETKRYKYD